MTETRRARPALATVISLWEVSIVVLAIAARVAIRGHHHAPLPPDRAALSAAHFVPASPLHTPGLMLGYALAIAGAVALWQMRRSAFVFLAARCVIELALPILAPAASHFKNSDSLIPLIVFIIDFFAFALNAAIAWYAYDITKPKRPRHRRHRSRRNHQVPEVEPTRETNPESTPATQDEPLTTSQFYLSPDHAKTI